MRDQISNLGRAIGLSDGSFDARPSCSSSGPTDLIATAVFAHVTWFENAFRYPVRFDLIVSSRTAVTLAACLIALLVLFALQRLLGDPNWPELALFKRMAIGAPTLVAVQSAVTLVFYGVQPALLSPAQRLGLTLPGLVLGGLELLVALSFITGLLDWAGAGLLALLVLVSFLTSAPLDALGNLYWLGIAVTVLFSGRQATEHGELRPPLRGLDRAWSARAVAILRVLTGIAIVASALREKIWDPELSAAFIRDHPQFNFPHQYLGLAWFTDDRFVLAAGIAEAVIGVLLVSGLLTRVVIVAMWVPFNITVPFLPPVELLGHLPIFAAMYVLLVHGAGVAPGEAPAEAARLPGSPAHAADAHEAGST